MTEMKNKEIFNDDEIPYEVRMLHLIKAYRRDQKKWTKLAEYAKNLEAEVDRLKVILEAHGFSETISDIEISSTTQLISDQRDKINKLKARINEIQDLKDASDRIKNLENTISEFPLRVYKARCFKEVIDNQEEYIKELQNLLDKNGITYYPRTSFSELEKEGVDKVIDKSVVYIKTKKELLEEVIKD